MTTRRIDEIVVGERHRRDLGDIASLARTWPSSAGCIR